MATVDNIRNGLIDKILSIRNKDFLEALDKIVSTSSKNEELVVLSDSQKKVLRMSEEDIANGRVISQDEMMKRNLEWLDGK